MNLDLTFYLKLFWRRLPVMMLFIMVSTGLGVITAVKLPETWKTSARLLVESQQIPDTMVASTVQIEAMEQLDIIQQKLLTRANLIDIANRFDVFENIRDMEPDTVVQQMQNATTIRRSTGRNEATVMTISFVARSGRIAADVVNEYVTLVLAGNADFRKSRASGTLQFFEQEAQRLSRELDQQSSAIADFKSENIEALPEDQSYRLGRQSLLQERISRLEREIAATEQQREDVVRIFETTGKISGLPEGAQPRSREEGELIAARAELEQALAVYSESHPRAVNLQRRIDRLKTIVAEQTESGQIGGAGQEEVSLERAMLQTTLSEIDNRLESLREEFASTTEELSEIQNLMSQSSSIGIQLAALERDYASTQARYNAAINNLNSAHMSERVETTAQGQRISVIENANIPRIPDGPDRTLIMAMGAAMGLALAGGYFLLLEILNTSVRRSKELTSRFDVMPLATIPYMESNRQRLARRGGIAVATLIVLIGAPAALWYIDTNYLPLEILVQKGLSQLGLG